ncbi:unnamed protein product, partial [Closterium sp. Naga37s-1]
MNQYPSSGSYGYQSADGASGAASLPASTTDKIQLPCAHCHAVLSVPVGLSRFQCPRCSSHLSVDHAKLAAYMRSLNEMAASLGGNAGGTSAGAQSAASASAAAAAAAAARGTGNAGAGGSAGAAAYPGAAQRSAAQYYQQQHQQQQASQMMLSSHAPHGSAPGATMAAAATGATAAAAAAAAAAESEQAKRRRVDGLGMRYYAASTPTMGGDGGMGSYGPAGMGGMPGAGGSLAGLGGGMAGEGLRAAQAEVDASLRRMMTGGRAGGPTAGEEARQVEADAKEALIQDEEDEEGVAGETFAAYRPAKLSLGRPHPDPVVETASLAGVQPPDIDPSKLALLTGQDDVAANALSSLQLETICYASQRHRQLLPGNVRAGFFLGDGAGVGKGRTVAGIIRENWHQGRRRALWISIGPDLRFDARRDLDDIGATDIPVHALNKLPYGKLDSKANKIKEGVLFLTYSTLIASAENRRSRLQQITQWCTPGFDGAIIFDECHKAKNLVPESGGNATRTGEAVMELQAKLPNARVVYCSATGASEPRHVGYMTRLGLWGDGTPFLNFQHFLGTIDKRGVGALELMAMDMKARGMYVCRTLSFDGAEFEVVHVPLEPSMQEMYSKAAQLWAELRADMIAAALALSSAQSASASDSSKRSSANAVWRTFWAAHQRFFRHLCISAKVPAAVRMVQQAIAEGKCVVIGLQSTGEARTDEAVAKLGTEMDDFVSGPREILLKLVEETYPLPPPPALPKQGEELKKEREREQERGVSRGVSVSQRGRVRRAVKYESDDSEEDGDEDFDAASETSSDDSDFQGDICQICHDEELSGSLMACAVCSRVGHVACFERHTGRSGGYHPWLADAPRGHVSTRSAAGSERLAGGTRNRGGDVASPIDLGDDDVDEEEEESGREEAEEGIEEEGRKKTKSRKAGGSSSGSEGGSSGQEEEGEAQVPWLCGECDKTTSEIRTERETYLSEMEARYNTAVARKAEIMEAIRKLPLPNNPLDELIDKLGGPEAVAEMTGRRGMLVRTTTGEGKGTVSYQARNSKDVAAEMVNMREKALFMAGDKLIAIISEAASAGISLQADRRAKNQRRRVHITVELPWSADRAIQQFGRSHRSNQASAPQYRLLFTELGGEKRFASVVAKRLESLGALTQGDRRAGPSLSAFNYEGVWGKRALSTMYRCIMDNMPAPAPPPGCPQKFDDAWVKFYQAARAALIIVGIVRDPTFNTSAAAGGMYAVGGKIPESDMSDVARFLNRMLGLQPAQQNRLFEFFAAIFAHLVATACKEGELDMGIISVRAPRITVTQPSQVVCEDEVSGGKTFHVVLTIDKGLNWESARQLFNDASAKVGQQGRAEGGGEEDGESGELEEGEKGKEARGKKRKQGEGEGGSGDGVEGGQVKIEEGSLEKEGQDGKEEGKEGKERDGKDGKDGNEKEGKEGKEGKEVKEVKEERKDGKEEGTEAREARQWRERAARVNGFYVSQREWLGRKHYLLALLWCVRLSLSALPTPLSAPSALCSIRSLLHLSAPSLCSISLLHLSAPSLFSISLLHLSSPSLFSISLLHLSAPSLCSISLLHLSAPSLFSISLLHLSAPSLFSISLLHLSAPSLCSISLLYLSSPSLCSVGLPLGICMRQAVHYLVPSLAFAAMHWPILPFSSESSPSRASVPCPHPTISPSPCLHGAVRQQRGRKQQCRYSDHARLQLTGPPLWWTFWTSIPSCRPPGCHRCKPSGMRSMSCPPLSACTAPSAGQGRAAGWGCGCSRCTCCMGPCSLSLASLTRHSWHSRRRSTSGCRWHMWRRAMETSMWACTCLRPLSCPSSM